MAVKSWKRAQVIGTREHLVETAARLFGARGYAATPLEELVGEAGLTRGAVYHHFKDKQALFEAVVDRVLQDLVIAVEKRAMKRAARGGGAPEPAALDGFVEELAEPRVQRILSIDGPAVLGEAHWSQLMRARLLEPIERVLERGVQAGTLDPERVPALARLLLGALREAALAMGSGGDDAAELRSALRLLLERVLGAGR